MEDQKLDRTWLCSVVFMDIVSYSKQSVQLQMRWKERFNKYLAEAIRDVAEIDRVILDTGDGAALCFLGDPEAAMFSALKLRTAFLHDVIEQQPGLLVRIGINLGPVKLVRDINGNLNAIGDGINVAQRVMNFASENQVLVSRSYYEVVGCLSDSYNKLFRYEGVRSDKHVREHSVYELIAPGSSGSASTHPPPSTSEPASPAAPVAKLDPLALAKIESWMVAYLGPMGRHLIQTHAVHATSLAALYSELANHIPSTADRKAFLGHCNSEFGETQSAAVPLDPALVDKARADLAHYIGPMAHIVVTRAAKTASTIQDLYANVADQIPDGPERQRFLEAHRGRG
jgi:class 3 adenylate cyclase